MAKARKTTKKAVAKVTGAKKVAGTKKKVTAYNRLQKAVSARCKNPTAANEQKVEAAKESYVKSAVAKGKSATDARKSANKADTCNPFKKKR